VTIPLWTDDSAVDRYPSPARGCLPSRAAKQSTQLAWLGSGGGRPVGKGGDGVDEPAGSAELDAAAIAGRDRAEVMLMPSGVPNCVAFSPDGTLMAIGAGTAVQLIDVRTTMTLRVLRGHYGGVIGVAFSPDGSLLVTGSSGGTVRVWDATTGEHRNTMVVPTGHVRDVGFLPDGDRIRATAWNSVNIWDLRTGSHHELDLVTGSPIVAWAPDGSGYATASSGTESEGHGEDRNYVTYHRMKIYHGLVGWHVAATGRPNVTTVHLGDRLRAVAYSPTGTLLAAASADQTVRIWRADTGAPHTTLAEQAVAVAFSPNDALIATVGARGVATWDVATGTHRATFADASDRGPSSVWDNPAAAAFSPDGAVLVTVAGGAVRAWDVATGRQQAQFGGYRPTADAVSVSPDGSAIATAHSDGTVRVWDSATGVQRAVLVGHDRAVTAVAYSPDGSAIAAAASDGTARVWDAATAAHRATMSGDLGLDTSIVWSPDGTQVATADHGWSIRIWDAETGEPQHHNPRWRAPWNRLWGASRNGPEAILYAPDGSLLVAVATGRIGEKMRIREVGTGRHRATLEHRHWLRTAAVSHDGSLLVTGGGDNTARVWRLPRRLSPTALLRLRQQPLLTLSGHGDDVTAVVFAPDGTLIATGGSGDCTARIWDAMSGEHRATLQHEDAVTGVAFSPGAARVVTTSRDGMARIWDARTGTVIASLAALPGGGYATLFPDGGYRTADPGGGVWWAIKLRRFAPGDLDPYVPEIRRLADHDR